MIEKGPLSAPTLDDIERALDEVVSALVWYRHSPPIAVDRARSKKSKGIRAISANDLVGVEPGVLRGRSLTSSPVEEGLKHSIRELGKMVHALAGNDGMQAVAERIAGLDENHWQRRISPINAAWDGIGHWYA